MIKTAKDGCYGQPRRHADPDRLQAWTAGLQPVSPNRRHFGRRTRTTCPGVRPKAACLPARRWRSFSQRSPSQRSRLARTILKTPTASCPVATLGSVSRGSTALGSYVFLAGECLGIVGTILYFSRDFPFSSAACPPTNVTYNQAIQIVTAYINARPQRIQERFIDLATEALHDAWP